MMEGEPGLKEEIELLSSMFCSKEEDCQIVSLRPTCHFKIATKLGDGRTIELIFEIDSSSYPDVITENSFDVKINRGSNNSPNLSEKLFFVAKKYQGSPLLPEVCREAIRLFEEENACRVDFKNIGIANEECDLSISLTQFDHMRNKKGYVKLIRQWIASLDLFYGLLLDGGVSKIFLILIGLEDSLKQFKVLLRTSTVDCDSRGRPCKEKMSKVLCASDKLADFCNTFDLVKLKKKTSLEVREFGTKDEFDAILNELNLSSFPEKYIASL